MEEPGEVGHVPGPAGFPGFTLPAPELYSSPDGPSAESAFRGFHTVTPPERQDTSSALPPRWNSLPAQLSCLTSLGRAGRMSACGSDLQCVKHRLVQPGNGAQQSLSLTRAGRLNISSCVGSATL